MILYYKEKKSWDLTIYLCHHLRSHNAHLTLPLAIHYSYTKDAKENINFDFGLNFLCFSLSIELWFWNKGGK